MKIISVLSAVIVLCSIGYVNASGTACFNFSNDNNYFRAAAQYNNGYISRGAFADGDIYDFAARVSQNLDGAISIGSTDRGTYDLGWCCPYTVKPSKMGFNEVLSFDNFKVGGSVGKMVFSGTNDYQPAIKLSFDSVQDMNLPSVACNSIPIMRLEAKNKSGGFGRLGDFGTNEVTGLSYNVPMSIRGCKCNNIQDDFRNICIVADAENKTGTCSDFRCYRGEKIDLGSGRSVYIAGLSERLKAEKRLKIKDIKTYKQNPGGAVATVEEHELNNLDNLINKARAGKVLINMGDVTKKLGDATKLNKAVLHPFGDSKTTDAWKNDLWNNKLKPIFQNVNSHQYIELELA